MSRHYKVNKRSFLLAESLIAFTLAIIILLFGASCIWTAIFMQDKSTKQFEKHMCKNMYQFRLRTILSAIKKTGTQKALKMYPQGNNQQNALLFTFDMGIFRNEKLANDVLGYLFFDKEGLKIAIHSDPTRKSMDQKEEQVFLLWPKATKVHWKFLGKKNLVDTSLEWTENTEDLDDLPLAISVTIGDETDPQEQTSGTKPFICTISETVKNLLPVKMDVSYTDLQELVHEKDEEENG